MNIKIKEKLRQYKTVRISGVKFKIRKVNPLIDFTSDKMPQIFSSFRTERKIDPNEKITEAVLRRKIDDMANMICAGLVEPKIDDDLKIEDVMCNDEVSYKLYTEILIHSLNKFRGVRGVFFSARLRFIFYMAWRKSMADRLSNLRIPMEIIP